MEKTDEAPQGTKDIFNQYAGSASIGGLPQWFSSYMIFFKFIWFCVLVGGLIATGVHLYFVVDLYLQYPIQVQLSIEAEDTMEFPSVTVCNLNAMKRKVMDPCDKKDFTLLQVQDQLNKKLLNNEYLVSAYQTYVKAQGSNPVLMMEKWLRKVMSMKDIYKCPSKRSEGDNSEHEHSNEGSEHSATTEAMRQEREVKEEENEEQSSYNTTMSEMPLTSDTELTSRTTLTSDAEMTTETMLASGTTLTSHAESTLASKTELMSETTPVESQPPGMIEQTESTNENNLDYDYDYEWMDKINYTDMNSVKFLENTRLSDLQDVRDLFAVEVDNIANKRMDSIEFIIECTMDRTPCYHDRSFEEIDNKRYGKCFVFNSGFLRTAPNKTKRFGSDYGLRLTLNIQADEYLGLLAQEYGVKLAVHDNRLRPVPEDDGVVAAPGFATEISVRRKDIRRKPHPYPSKCMNEIPDEYKGFSNERSAYGLKQCQLACADYHLNKECHCIQQLFKLNDTTLTCSIFNDVQRKCLAKTTARFYLDKSDENYLQCNCKPACHDILFEQSLSLAKWPTDPYQRVQMNNFFNKKGHLFANTLLERLMDGKVFEQENYDTWLSRNLVRVHVYFESLTLEVIRETEAYPLSQLWADFGGIAGLYLGMSAVTLVELLQLSLMLAHSMFKKKPIEPNK